MSEIPEGKVKLHVHAHEKIGLPNYSNVEIGASITFYEDEGTDADYLNALKAKAHGVVEAFIAEERQAVLDMVKTG